MSGYTGNPDAESEHALILAENGINAAQSLVEGPVLEECLDCGRKINPARVEAMRKIKMRCIRCIECQPKHDKAHGIKMLDRIL